MKKPTFDMVPEMIADPVRHGFKRLKEISANATRMIGGDLSVDVPPIKDFSVELTLLKKATGLADNVMATMAKV